ncbi:hypothetical protein QC761_0074750 [Podospora bellae-mahoneyi]|uniref:DUF8212 domain-containing protein n=1 Tax=Podospora bellae-mahoneyi TaxID=2093777 RepID=A0ABR0FC05_9PEZI|nr:hypothetical protein QC761_0074750 [Podospora bellae-mahoneyi]
MYRWYQEAEVCLAYLADVPSGKLSLQRAMANRIGIPSVLFAGESDIDGFSVAQKMMSWAAGRETTRVEGCVYSLLGIFDINMPLMYGEKKNAFIRLQEEIMKISDDHSLFAWKSLDTRGGLLTTSPDAFINSGNILGFMPPGSLGNNPLTASGRGIHIELRFIGIGLNCRQKEVEEKPIAIHLRNRLFGTV